MTDEIPDLIRELYAIVRRLEGQFPERRFTLDGHLVGSIGEVIAADRYGLRLLPAGAPAHDALTVDGARVQIKATQGRQIGMRAEPEHLVVLRIDRNGKAVEVYNGPGGLAWNAAGPMQRNGQRAIGVAKLGKIAATVAATDRIPRLR